MQRRLDAAYRIWMLLILAYFGWTAYLIGWTDHYTGGGDSLAVGSWSARASYAGHGLYSVAHLNLISVALGTGVAFGAVLAATFLLPRFRLVRDHFDLFALTAVLTGLSVYTFVLIDTPSNYYHSRYFLPVIVPLIVLYAARRLASAPRWLFAGVIVSVLIFALPYTGLIVCRPILQDTSEVIRTARAVVPPDSIVLAWGTPGLDRLITNVVKYDLSSAYLYLGTDAEEAADRLGTFLPYLRGQSNLRGQPIFLITDQAQDLPFELPHLASVTIRNNQYVDTPLYPHESHSHPEDYAFYEVTIESLEPLPRPPAAPPTSRGEPP